jgi:hypothetical protein
VTGEEMKDVVLHLPGGCVSHWRNHSIDDAIFLAELGRQITLLAIDDGPPDDDDYDWQQN